MIILSIPFGPNDVFNKLAIAKPAFKFYFIASNPLTLFFLFYSLTIIYGRPNSSNASDIYTLEYSYKLINVKEY